MFLTATEDLRKDPASAAIFLKKNEPYSVGDRVVQKDLARTLKLIARHGTGRGCGGPV